MHSGIFFLVEFTVLRVKSWDFYGQLVTLALLRWTLVKREARWPDAPSSWARRYGYTDVVQLVRSRMTILHMNSRGFYLTSATARVPFPYTRAVFGPQKIVDETKWLKKILLVPRHRYWPRLAFSRCTAASCSQQLVVHTSHRQNKLAWSKLFCSCANPFDIPLLLVEPNGSFVAYSPVVRELRASGACLRQNYLALLWFWL